MSKDVTARDKSALQAIEEATLAPYAQRSFGAPRRYQLRDQGRTLAYRTEFQRDRDRILHSQAFRRLKHKTQVYVAYEGDHHRTRLTHTLEVSQVARTVARALGLNEDLVEAIALGHDLGQPPFGAGGVEVMTAILDGDEKIPWVRPEVLERTGGFRPAYQSLRVVDRLEARYDHPGLNLSDPVREGIWKSGVHGGPSGTRLSGGDAREKEIEYPDFKTAGLHVDEPPLLEAQVVAVADRVARLTHDLEDGIRSGEIALTEVERTDIGRAIIQKLGDSYPDTPSHYRRRNAQVRGIIHTLVSDLVVDATDRLQEWLEANPHQEELRELVEEPEEVEKPEEVEEAEGAGEAEEAEEEEEGSSEATDDGDNGQETEATAPTREDRSFQPAPRLPADTIAFSDRIEEMVRELEEMMHTHVYRSRTVRRLDARARTFLTGLFAAYYQDPLQLDDYALHRYRAQAGGAFLRDVPEERVDEEIEQRYHGRPAFLRVITDHVAGMSDTYALKEYERLYLPFPDVDRGF